MRASPLATGDTASTPWTCSTARATPSGDAREAVGVDEGQVAGERLVDGLVEGLGDRGGEGRHERDQRQPDHQRRRRGGRATWVAKRVLARKSPGDAAQALDRPADDRRDRPDQAVGQHRDADEQQHQARAEELEGERPRCRSRTARRRSATAPSRRQRRRRSRSAAGSAERRASSPGSRSASSGVTRVARSAGTNDATIVETRPTTRATITVLWSR